MSLEIKRLSGLTQTEFEAYQPDPESIIDCAYYGYECALRQHKVTDPDEILSMTHQHSEAIKHYYKDRDNWYCPKEAAAILGCSNKTAKKWFYAGYIRGEIEEGLYQKVKLCKYDVLSIKEELNEKGYKRKT